MANLTLQLTIPAGGVANLAAALPQPTGGKGNVVGQPPVGSLYVQFLQLQYNGANSARYGFDNKVSVTVPAAVAGGVAGRGILLSSGGAGSVSTAINYSTYLSDVWIAGTVGDVIDALAIE